MTIDADDVEAIARRAAELVGQPSLWARRLDLPRPTQRRPSR
ncbi:MAG: hypothetical protein ACXVHX_25665 [Solirubrobacteraceae bacterium]